MATPEEGAPAPQTCVNCENPPCQGSVLAPEASSPTPTPRSLQAAASQGVFLLLKVNQAPSPVLLHPHFQGQEKLATLSEFSFSFVPCLEIRSEGS